MHRAGCHLHLEELESRTLLSGHLLNAGHGALLTHPSVAGSVQQARFSRAAAMIPNAAPTAPTAVADRLQGIEISAGVINGNVRNGATFVGRAAGSLPGFWGVSINYTPAHPGPGVTNTIVGGYWALAVVQGGVFQGVVYGAIAPGGTVAWNPAGTVAAVSANLTILGGTGAFVGAAGTGTFTGTLSHLTFPPTLGGALQLTLAH